MSLVVYLTRVLRKKPVVAAVTFVSFLFFTYHFIYEPTFSSDSEFGSAIPLRNLESFVWRTDEEDDTGNSSLSCRNSVQGKLLLVDDRGYLCTRSQVLPMGCCDHTSRYVRRYPCHSCRQSGCCGIYEYCVSCCLNPNKKDVLRGVLSRAPAAFHVVFSAVNDQFELCLAKCRTSSLSVHHENSYRDASAKHCYTDAIPADTEPP